MKNLIGQRIIIIPEKPQEKTMFGIYIPEQSQEERNVGLIAVIGDTVDKRFEMRRVIYPKLIGEKIHYEGLDALLMYACEVIAFLD